MKVLNQQGPDTREVLICACGHLDHQVVLEYWDWEDDFTEVTLSINLNPYLKWYWRLYLGLRYIFGMPFKRDMWDVVILTEQDLKKMKSFVEKTLK